jgi:hypothetical protein
LGAAAEAAAGADLRWPAAAAEVAAGCEQIMLALPCKCIPMSVNGVGTVTHTADRIDMVGCGYNEQCSDF